MDDIHFYHPPHTADLPSEKGPTAPSTDTVGEEGTSPTVLAAIGSSHGDVATETVDLSAPPTDDPL